LKYCRKQIKPVLDSKTADGIVIASIYLNVVTEQMWDKRNVNTHLILICIGLRHLLITSKSYW